jgi:hypothetical protein
MGGYENGLKIHVEQVLNFYKMNRKVNTSFRVGRVLSFMSLMAIAGTIMAQEAGKSEVSVQSPFVEANKEKMFAPVVGIESWAVFSMGEEKAGTAYADRADFSIRRLRFGASGAPYSWLQYHFQLHLDRLGEDPFASTKGSYGGLDIWNANISAKLLKDSELLYLEAGYYWAAISREFNTSAWSQGSFDRTRANWYMRNFITGKGNGIESGIGLGGVKNFQKWGIGYRLGSFEPQAYLSSKYASRLYTGHVLFSFGDPEQPVYKYRLPGNHWGKRKGVTIGLGASSQSDGKLTDTTFFDLSAAYGADILINYKGLRIDGEYFMFNRQAANVTDFDGTQWHIRVGYNLILAGKYIEPVITYDKYEGKGAKSLYKFIGSDHTLDVGVNWYLNKDKLKLALHYLIQDGSVSPNNGDYVGLAFQVRL